MTVFTLFIVVPLTVWGLLMAQIFQHRDDVMADALGVPRPPQRYRWGAAVFATHGLFTLCYLVPAGLLLLLILDPLARVPAALLVLSGVVLGPLSCRAAVDLARGRKLSRVMRIAHFHFLHHLMAPLLLGIAWSATSRRGDDEGVFALGVFTMALSLAPLALSWMVRSQAVREMPAVAANVPTEL